MRKHAPALPGALVTTPAPALVAELPIKQLALYLRANLPEGGVAEAAKLVERVDAVLEGADPFQVAFAALLFLHRCSTEAISTEGVNTR